MLTATSSDKVDISSEKKTEDFAYKFQQKIKPGLIVFLHGEIGVGKTTFVRHLINGYQKENELELTEVTSPTFNLCNQYQIKNIKINHYDLFRIKSVEETKNLGLFDNLSNSITLVEWPQIIKEKLPDTFILALSAIFIATFFSNYLDILNSNLCQYLSLIHI